MWQCRSHRHGQRRAPDTQDQVRPHQYSQKVRGQWSSFSKTWYLAVDRCFFVERNTNESFDTELLDSSIFGQTSKSSAGLKRLRFNDHAVNNDLERSIFSSINNAATGADPNASDLFDYFNPPSTSHAVIATYSASMPGTSASFLSEPAKPSSLSSNETPSDQQASKSTAEGRTSVVVESAETRSPERSADKRTESADDYIPELTDQQRRQLDEQLRNVIKHCQLTITRLVSILIKISFKPKNSTSSC